MKRCVVITGAGISAESGLETYRSETGLWSNHKIEEVCTLKGFYNDSKKVIDFYNQRRRECEKAQPNLAHLALVELEKKYNVQIITQNIDDLHERAGSTQVLHLHGQLNKLRSSFDKDYIIDWQGDQTNETDPYDYPMRPHIVFFWRKSSITRKSKRSC